MMFANWMKAVVGGVAALALASCAQAPLQSSAQTIRGFSIAVQSTKPEETKAAWQPLIDDIGRKHGLATTLIVGTQAETVNALRDGKADVVWLSSNVAIDAVVDAGAEAFALYINVNGSNGYKGVVITHAESGIATLEDALTPGKHRYASGAKTSTSGYVLPQHFLFGPRKTTPEALFKNVVYGGHFPNLDLLWARKVDVAVNNSTDLAVFQARTPGAKEGIRVLWESPLVPNDVLMVRRGKPALKVRLKEIFFSYGKEAESEKVLLKKASGISHFVETDDRVLEPVAGFKFDTEQAAIEGIPNLTVVERAVRLAVHSSRAAWFYAYIAAVNVAMKNR
jgi:phosphonate transport system substrate-binding protein